MKMSKCHPNKPNCGKGLCRSCWWNCYYQKNKKVLRDNNRRWLQNNSERQKTLTKTWRQTNKEHVQKYDKKYAKLHKVKRSAYMRKYINIYNIQRRKRDPLFKLLCLLRTRLWKAVKNKESKKYKSTIELTGCTVKDLKAHLEKQFQSGMSWKNYGKWHIDHIKPCISFDLVKEEEQRKCFHYSNLQPLWAFDNTSKGAKL